MMTSRTRRAHSPGNRIHAVGLFAAIVLMAVSSIAAHAQKADTFYQAREIKLVLGFTAGGAAEIYGRVVARHLSRHIPGAPLIVVQFMPGAGSLTAANWLYNAAPRDGTVIGSIHSSVTLEPLYGFDRARFDVMRFTWLGSVSTDYGVTLTWEKSQTRTLADAQRRETLVGGLGPGSASDFAAVLLNEFVGTKLKVISGYRGVNDILIAMERGEVEGMGSWAWTALLSYKPDWVRDGKLNFLVQSSSEPHPELTARGIPFILDFVKNPDDRQVVELGLAFMGVGRPYVAPPGLPEERAATLQRAFASMLTDPEFVADATERKLEVTRPKNAQEMEALLRRVYATPKPVVQRVLDLQKKDR